MRNWYSSIICFLLCLVGITVNAAVVECSIENANDPNGGFPFGTDLVGQQFLACDDGFIESIEVQTSGGNLDLYLVTGNGSAITYGVPLQSFSGTPSGLVKLELTNPFPVNDGQLYAFAIGGMSTITLDMSPTSGTTPDPTVPDGQFLFLIDNGNNCLLYTSPSPRD